MPGREFAIARVRGLHGRLLGNAGLEELLALPDLHARLQLLRQSDYGLALPPDPLSARAAAHALRGQLARDTARVLALFDDAEAQKVLQAAVAFADVLALKTILRGDARGESSARIIGLVMPTLELDEGAVKELAGQRGVAGVVNLLETWSSRYAAPLRAAMGTEQQPRDLLPLELALDRTAFARARATLRGGLGGVVATLIDLANATTLLKLGGRAGDLFIPGGAVLTEARFQALARLPAPVVAVTLAADRRLALAPAFAGDQLLPFHLDRLVEERVVRALLRLSRLEPLSLAVPLLYLALRRAEIRRIRLVLEAAALELPLGDIFDLVVGA